MSTQVISAATKLKKIRESFIKQIPTQLEAIRKGCVDLGQEAAWNDILEELHRRIHTLKGASASFGLKKLSVAAAAGSFWLKRPSKPGPDPTRSGIVRCRIILPEWNRKPLISI